MAIRFLRVCETVSKTKTDSFFSSFSVCSFFSFAILRQWTKAHFPLKESFVLLLLHRHEAKLIGFEGSPTRLDRLMALDIYTSSLKFSSRRLLKSLLVLAFYENKLVKMYFIEYSNLQTFWHMSVHHHRAVCAFFFLLFSSHFVDNFGIDSFDEKFSSVKKWDSFDRRNWQIF